MILSKRNVFLFIVNISLGCSSFLIWGCKKDAVVVLEDNTPSITSFAPLIAKSGDTVILKGRNFAEQSPYNLISIGNYSVIPFYSSVNSLSFKIPIGVQKGSYKITVKIGGKSSSSLESLEILESSVYQSTDVLPVNKSIILQAFEGFGKRNVHPRLLFYKEDIERIKRSVLTDPVAKASYDDIINRANSLLSSPLLNYGLDEAKLRISNIHQICNNQIPYLVLAYIFTNDNRYALRCWQQLEIMCQFPDWGANRHFLDTGIAAKGMALAYDGLFDYLNPNQKLLLWESFKKHALIPGKAQIESKTGVWKWYLSDDNWNGICHSGLIMAALAMFESDPSLNAEIIALATNGMEKYIASFEPDGGSEEGMSYWSYGLSNTFLGIESLERCLSTSFGITEKSGFKRTGWFPYLMAGPVGTATIGDDYLYVGKNKKILSYFWFAHHFKDANLAKVHFQACQSVNEFSTVKWNGWTDLLFYNKDLISSGANIQQPLSGYLKGIEYYYLLEKNESEHAMYLGMHGGDNNASHGHLDAGSFYIQAFGETWAMGNLGLESPYPADYFTVTSPKYSDLPTQSVNSPGRFYYYRIRAEGKNTLIFNPDARPEQNPAGVARSVKSVSDENGGFHVIDLSACYSRDVSAYQRGIKLNRKNNVMTVQDQFTPLNNISTFYWLMHTPNTEGLIITANGKKAVFNKNGKTFQAEIISPSQASFEKVDKSASQILYLKETADIFSSVMAGKNSPNKQFGKLQIKLQGLQTKVPYLIRIDFSNGDNMKSSEAIDLNNWTTSN